MIDAWLTKDPETERVFIQNREFGVDDFPRGRRGLGWPVRKIKIDEDDFEKILHAIHRHDFVEEIWNNIKEVK